MWLYYWRPYCDFIIEDPIVTLLLKTLLWLFIEDRIVTF